MDLNGRSIVITGAGNGIGRQAAAALAAAGAQVTVADIDERSAADAADQIRHGGGRAVACQCDISDAGAGERMADRALEAYGRIDGLLNNAALMSSLPRRPWHEIPPDEWDQVMAVNLRGVFLCCRAVWPAMKQAGEGAIVNISSSRVFDGTPNRLHYTTSKAGLVGFTRALAREVGADGIRVNAIAPGLTLSQRQIETTSPDYLAEMTRGRALARAQTADDVIGAILFFLSPASSFITGQTLVVDGGKVMR